MHADMTYSGPSGFVLVDTSIMAKALTRAQQCPCLGSLKDTAGRGAALSLWELPRHTFADGLNSALAFVCSSCNKATAFFTSPLTDSAPAAFTANKELRSLLGEKAFSTLVSFCRKRVFTNAPVIMKRGKFDAKVSLVKKVDKEKGGVFLVEDPSGKASQLADLNRVSIGSVQVRNSIQGQCNASTYLLTLDGPDRLNVNIRTVGHSVAQDYV